MNPLKSVCIHVFLSEAMISGKELHKVWKAIHRKHRLAPHTIAFGELRGKRIKKVKLF